MAINNTGGGPRVCTARGPPVLSTRNNTHRQAVALQFSEAILAKVKDYV